MPPRIWSASAFQDRGRILTRVGRAPEASHSVSGRGAVQEADHELRRRARGSGAEKIEFLGDGQQFVVLGIHPDTQGAYVWNGGDPTTVDYTDLPEISAAEARELRDDLVALLVGTSATSRSRREDAPEHGQRGKAAPKSTARDAAWARSRARSGVRRHRPRAERRSQRPAQPLRLQRLPDRVGQSRPPRRGGGPPAPLRGGQGLRPRRRRRRRRRLEDHSQRGRGGALAAARPAGRRRCRVRPRTAALGSPAPASERESARRAEPARATGAGPAPSPAPGPRPIIQTRRRQRHRIVDEAEDALIAAGGFDLYQRDAVMVRPVMQRLPAAGWHGVKRTTVLWRLMLVKPLYLNEMLGRVARLSELRRAGAGTGSTRIAHR